MELYHCTHLDLDNGSTINPGNWGKKIFEVGPSHESWKREIALEAVRSWHFPQKPSRLYGTFSCEHVDTIKCYKSKHCPNGHLYKVEIIDEDAPIHKGDFNAIEPLPRGNDDMWRTAIKYWQYLIKTNVEEWPNVECSEILTSSPLKVIGRLS